MGMGSTAPGEARGVRRRRHVQRATHAGGWDALDAAFYAEWKRNGSHIKEYLSEGVETAALLFCVVGAVAVMFGASSPVSHAIPSTLARLFITGLILGAASWLIALSPPGKLSGAHINPAVSLGFWALGKMTLRDTLGYCVAQMVGAPLGVALGAVAFGPLARQVKNATLAPGLHIGPFTTIAGETLATLALTFVIYTCLSHKRLQPYTPAIAMLMVGALVGLDGMISGAGMNPARWFGPALSYQRWALFWAYSVGPILGAIAAALLRRYGAGIIGETQPHTGKIVHDSSYRSIFRHDRMPSTPPPSVQREKRKPRQKV